MAPALIWLVSGWSLRPVARASREAALVGPGKPETRISPDGLPREIQPLVEAVNGALDRLSSAYAAERRLTANAAHELRTPLAVLHLRLQRAQLTGIADWAAIEWQIGQMSRLVNQLIDLARKESSERNDQSEELPIVNLSRIAREAAAAVLPLIEEQGRCLKAELPDNAQLRGRADDLRDMIRNLLDNALVHGRSTVTLILRPAVEPNDRVIIEVCDEGGGVPLGHEELVFERFRKLNAESPGAGLGLAIVRQVARSHGGDVHFAKGSGRVILWLPLRPDANSAF
jgi:two-component system sensor histidine kinase QseC